MSSIKIMYVIQLFYNQYIYFYINIRKYTFFIILILVEFIYLHNLFYLYLYFNGKLCVSYNVHMITLQRKAI